MAHFELSFIPMNSISLDCLHLNRQVLNETSKKYASLFLVEHKTFEKKKQIICNAILTKYKYWSRSFECEMGAFDCS